MIGEASAPTSNFQVKSFDWAKGRRSFQDPFYKLPDEIKVEVFRYLTSTDIFSLKQASLFMHLLELPTKMYRRFIREEFDFFPPLVTAVKRYEERNERNEMVDWKASFERIRKSIRTPEPGDGSEWDEIDISLKNRNRIWKIVKPMAQEFVETCPIVLRKKYRVPAQLANRTTIVRGWVGTRSGREGVAESAYFGDRAYNRRDTGGLEDEVELHETETTELIKVRVYLSALKEVSYDPGLLHGDDNDGCQLVCGLGFRLYDHDNDCEEDETQIRRFGRKSFLFEDVDIPMGKYLIGFVVCFTKNVVSGVRLVFGDSSFSSAIGKWGGVVRKIIAPPEYRVLVGVTGFVNSSGFIEKIGLLEETLSRKSSDRYGIIHSPPLQVELSHEESSAWRILPPNDVRFLEREGLKIRNWQLHMTEWEVWDAGYEGEGAIPSSTQRTNKYLREIVGYYDNEFLRGLVFKYETLTGWVESRAGVVNVGCVKKIGFSMGERVSAMVISSGVGGIHSIVVEHSSRTLHDLN